MGEIYKITNILSGKSYIGKTKHDSTVRWRDHVNGYHPSSLIHKAIVKYGVENFSFEIVETGVLEQQLNQLEMNYISTFNTKAPNGYNLTDGGDGGTGLVVSDETRKKQSSLRKGKPWTKCQREVLSKSRLGNNNAGRKVAMIKNDVIIAVFDSAKSASDETGIYRTNISRSCNHSNLKAGGYHWRFI